MSLVKIVLRSKFPWTKFVKYKCFEMGLGATPTTRRVSGFPLTCRGQEAGLYCQFYCHLFYQLGPENSCHRTNFHPAAFLRGVISIGVVSWRLKIVR